MEEEREITKQQTAAGEVVTEKTTTTPTHADSGELNRARGVFQVRYIIYYILGVVEILLVLRLIFKGLGANPGSGFVSFIYSVTDILIAPFAAIFRTTTTQGVETTAVLEPATLIAIVVYALLAWGISALIGTLTAGRE